MKKKLFMFLFLCLAFLWLGADSCFADRIGSRYLSDTTNGKWVDLSMSTTTATYTSSGIKVDRVGGFTSLLVKTSTGTLAITYQVSTDNTNWYTPYDTDGNALNVIATAMGSNTWVEFDPTIAQYVRFVFVLTVENPAFTAASTVSAYLIYNE